MKKSILLVLVSLITIPLYAQVTQEWAARYDGPASSTDITKSMTVDAAGNVYVTGVSNTGGSNYDYATVKYSSTGTQLWAARYPAAGNPSHLPVIAIDGSGNVFTGGRVFPGSATQYDYVVIKYNSAGVQQWAVTYNGTGTSLKEDEVTAITADASGNVYVTGTSWGSSTATDFVTIKYNSAGVQQWTSRYNRTGTSEETPHSIAVDAAGNVYITGESISNFSDYVTIKYNSAGAQQWASVYGVPAGHDKPYALTLDASGNVYVTGYAYSTNGEDYATVKYNSAGAEQWASKYNGPGNGNDEAYSLAVDNNGNVFVTGFSPGSGTQADYATIKYGSDGTQLWASRYNGTGNGIDNAYSLALDGSGNVYVTGSSKGTSAALSEFVTLKYNTSGAQQWAQRYTDAGIFGNSTAHAISVDNSGNVYIAGEIDWTSSFRDYSVIKYSQSTGITPLSSEIPEKYSLSQNYPNPFNPITNFEFSMGHESPVKLVVYNSLGKEAAVLVNQNLKAGVYKYSWDASNFNSGVYFYRLTAEGFSETKKMMLVK